MECTVGSIRHNSDRSIHRVITQARSQRTGSEGSERFHNKSGSARLFMGLQHGLQYNEMCIYLDEMQAKKRKNTFKLV